jgi:hypothetical protein
MNFATSGTQPLPLSKEDLQRIVKEGVVTDILRADRSYDLLKTIGTHAERINASPKNFGELFGTIQGLAMSEALLSVARLYDAPSRRYPTLCLRALLDLLDERAHGLPSIVDRSNLCGDLVRAGMPQATADRAATATDVDVTRMVISYFRDQIAATPTVRSIELLRNVRDKRIAHNESVQVLDSPTWTAVLELLTIAKQIVGVVGWAYLGTVYMHEGRYTLSSDSERSGLALVRLLEESGVVESRWGRHEEQPSDGAP